MTTDKKKRSKSGRAGHHSLAFIRFSADILKLKLDTAVVDYLVSRLVLTTEDAELIRQTQVTTDRNKCLLNILKDRPYNTFRIFIESLKTANPINNELINAMETFEVADEQPHVKYADECIELDDLSIRFQKSYKDLVDQITSPIKIVDILMEQETLNREDSEDISSLNTTFQQNRALLSKIANKGKYGCKSLLRALRMSVDARDQEIACEVENTEISQNDILLLQIGITLSQENGNIPLNIKEIARQFEECWIEKDVVFVETRGTSKVYETIVEHDFVTIVGKSGSGKTAAMRHVVLKLKYEKRFKIIPVDNPNKILEYGDSNAKLIFLFDDVLGTYGVNPILVEKWEKLDAEIQHCLRKNPGKIKLLFTLRKQVLNDRKFVNLSSIITENKVDLDDDQIALSKKEKRQILFRHLKINGVEIDISEHDEDVFALDFAFPLLCRIVSSNEERLKNIGKFFREPFSVLKEELNKLWTRNKEVYCSLVLCMLLNGKVVKDLFDVKTQRHEMLSIVAEACGLNSNISRQALEDSLVTVVGTYVSCDNGIYHFIHDALYETISSHFANVNLNVMLSFCAVNLIRDRIRVDSRLSGDDENMIVIRKDQFEVIAERILTECEEGRFSNVLSSHIIKNESFVEYFGTKLRKKSVTAIKTLMEKVSKERRNNNLKDMILEMWRSFKETDTITNKIDENNAAIKAVIRAPSRQSTFIHWIIAFGCHKLFSVFWKYSSKKEQRNLLSRDLIFKFTRPCFPLAILSGDIDIIRTLYSGGADVNCFSLDGETPLSITAKNGREEIATVLIELGADVNQPDMFSHRFPSFICVQNEHVEVLKILLNNNCDVNLVDIYGNNSTMLQAMLTRKRHIVNILLEFDSKDHPLQSAILNCDIGSFKSNLSNGHINSETRNGLTPLHYATQVNSITMINLLSGSHGDLTSVAEVPTDQMEVSCSQIMHLLPPVVANINSRNKNGLTPLHLAVLNDHVEAVKLLVQRNADVNAKDQFGRIPLHYSQIPVISSLLLGIEISKSAPKRSTQCSCTISENQSHGTIVTIGDDQMGHLPTKSYCTLFSEFCLVLSAV